MKIIKSMIFLMIVILFLPLAFSANPYFGINLDCLESCKEGIVDPSKSIMLKLEIKNNFDYWISLGTNREYGSPDLRITTENSNLKDGKDVEMYSGILGGPTFLKPKSVYEVYLPFEIYNNLNEDRRLGEWKIIPEFLPGDVKYFKSPYDGKQVTNIKPEYKIPSSIKGNILKFEPKKEEVEVVVKPDEDTITKAGDSVKEFFKKWGGYIIAGIIILVVGGLILFLIKKK